MITLGSLVIAGLLNTATAAIEPLPGQTLERYRIAQRGLAATGGVAVPRLRPGFSFQVWEDHLGKEYRYSKTFVSGDPTDTTGYVYLPKTTILVQKSPTGPARVVVEKRSFIVKTDQEIDTRVQAEEKFLASSQLPPKTLLDRFKKWWRTSVVRDAYLQTLVDDGRFTIYKGEAQGGKMVNLVLAPYLESEVVVSSDETSEDGEVQTLSPETQTNTATASVAGVMKVVRYLKQYEKLALEDLAPIITSAELRLKKK